MTDKVVAHWIQKLAKFHWSPKHPASYLVKHKVSGELVGLGKVAMQFPGSFNLAWACSGESLSTYPEQVRAVAFFSKASIINKYVIDGAELEEWLTVHTRAEYAEWFKTIASRLPDSIRALHSTALGTYAVPKL